MSGHPRRGDDRVVHVVALGERWREVIHERDAGEPGGLGGLGAFDDSIERQAHLGQEEADLHHAHGPIVRNAKLLAPAGTASSGSLISSKVGAPIALAAVAKSSRSSP